MKVQQRICLTAIALLCLVSGCAGAGIDVTARRSTYPISMSGAVRDSTGTMLDTRFLKVVSPFHVEQTRIGILYSSVTPRSTIDISDEVNSQVAAADGEAIIRLSVTVDTVCNALNAFPVLNMVPVWPGCVPVIIDGLIVKRRALP
jgi:hypothetical protein